MEIHAAVALDQARMATQHDVEDHSWRRAAQWAFEVRVETRLSQRGLNQSRHLRASHPFSNSLPSPETPPSNSQNGSNTSSSHPPYSTAPSSPHLPHLCIINCTPPDSSLPQQPPLPRTPLPLLERPTTDSPTQISPSTIPHFPTIPLPNPTKFDYDPGDPSSPEMSPWFSSSSHSP